VLKDELFAASGMLPLFERAFRGELSTSRRSGGVTHALLRFRLRLVCLTKSSMSGTAAAACVSSSL
jgi:hypothetical protein